jgi:hypothetical protein
VCAILLPDTRFRFLIGQRSFSIEQRGASTSVCSWKSFQGNCCPT